MRARGVALLVGATLAAIALVGGFVALGGADRLRAEEARAADACASEPLVDAPGDAMEATASRLLLLALRDAACELGVPREDLVVALARSSSLAAAAAELDVAPAALEQAVLTAITTATDAEEAEGRLTPTTALAIRTLVEVVPPDRLLRAVQGTGDACGELQWVEASTLDEVAAQIGVRTGLRAACALGVPPLEAVAALADPAGLDGLATRAGRSPADVEGEVRAAIEASVQEAVDAGALTPTEGSILGSAARVAPVDRLLAIVRGDDDPCASFPWPGSESRSEALAAIVLIGVVDAACQLDVTTFDAFAALADPAELQALIETSGRSEAEIEEALKAGLDQGVAEAEAAGGISGLEALLLRAVLSQVGILDLLNALSG